MDNYFNPIVQECCNFLMILTVHTLNFVALDLVISQKKNDLVVMLVW